MIRTPLVVSLRIPGEWRDAWLYKQRLIIWQRDNSMLSVNVDRVLDGISHEYDGATATAIEYILMRNDWKNSEQFRKLLNVPGVERSLRSAIRASKGTVSLTADSLAMEPARAEPASGVMLDSHIYANRIYCASTEGLFESYFQTQRGIGSPQEQLMSRRVAHVSARYACLNVSAEEEGLWYQPIHIGDRHWSGTPADFVQAADVSLGTSYASRHLLNYVDDAVPQFLRAEAHKGRVSERSEYDEWQVSGYQAPRDITRAAISALTSKGKVELGAVAGPADVDKSEIQVLGNANYRLLVQWRNKLRVLDISAYEDKDIALRPDERFKLTERIPLDAQSVLETYAIGNGFLVETFDEVRMLTQDGSHPFFSGAAARVRTFTSSRRHKDVAMVIDDTALHLIGFLRS